MPGQRLQSASLGGRDVDLFWVYGCALGFRPPTPQRLRLRGSVFFRAMQWPGPTLSRHIGDTLYGDAHNSLPAPAGQYFYSVPRAKCDGSLGACKTANAGGYADNPSDVHTPSPTRAGTHESQAVRHPDLQIEMVLFLEQWCSDPSHPWCNFRQCAPSPPIYYYRALPGGFHVCHPPLTTPLNCITWNTGFQWSEMTEDSQAAEDQIKLIHHALLTQLFSFSCPTTLQVVTRALSPNYFPFKGAPSGQHGSLDYAAELPNQP